MFLGRLLILSTLSMTVASAAVMNWNATLNGAQETPPNASPATGSGTGTYDTVSMIFSWDVSFSGLTAPETDAHFHIAPPGVAGPITIPLPLGSPIMGSQALSAVQEAAFLAGDFYVNIHSSNFPAGEIRGQVLPQAVPEPSTWALAFTGIAALIGRRLLKS